MHNQRVPPISSRAFVFIYWYGFSARKQQKKGSGKARGRHHPGNSEDTFGSILNDDRGSGARTGKGAQPSSSSTSHVKPSAAAAAAATTHSDRRTPRGSREGRGGGGGGGGGFKPPNRQRGRGKNGTSSGGGGGRAGGHSFAVTGVDPWGPFPQGGGWRSSGGARGGGARARGGFDEGFVRRTEGMVLFWKEPACFVQWTPCCFEVQGVSQILFTGVFVAERNGGAHESAGERQLCSCVCRERSYLGSRTYKYVYIYR